MDDFFVEDEPLESIEAAFAAGRRVVTRRPASASPSVSAGTTAKFELLTTKTGQFRFTLKAANGTVIATSETYTTKAAALRAIESVKTSAADAAIESMTG